ncbi:putative secreted protein [Motilibacter rhizosphaerae]|uniref:Putative secreted protein n=1 Tax=Motilibacter rhizosphaerae TaxID=598652 RepID=A0A4Q7NSC8_9ACTN|nr:protease inhibitor I42 family protein [Motilibacter rhizosphaerae]RZS89760.1 putative secreted protein [Motilibacter rhizosphaerae]
MGEVRTARVGEQVALAVPERRTGGYRWVVRSEPEGALEVVADDWEPPEGDAPGAVGTRRLAVRVAAPGRLLGVRARSWEAASGEGTVLLEVRVA